MGILRTLFAISVVFAHTYGFALIGGRNAVQLFYMISGFLISYVLIEKRAYSKTVQFYVNRFLRLYPTYCVVALLTLLVFLFGGGGTTATNAIQILHTAPPSAIALLVTANGTLLFQDWAMFLGFHHSHLSFVADFRDSDVPLYFGLLVPQAWTLGLELSFYLIAPFLLPRRRVMYAALFFSLLVRFCLYALGVATVDPWSYRFFPAELALFLIGALTHQVLLPLYKRWWSVAVLHYMAIGATATMVALCLFYWLVPIREAFRAAVLFPMFLLVLPLSFVFQSTRRWDKWIGDLSYPIYICHMLVLMTLQAFLPLHGHTAYGLFAVVASVAFAIALNFCVAAPIERLRDRFRRPGATADLHLIS